MDYWYVLHTKPHAEHQVAATLQQCGLEIFLPEIDLPREEPKKKPFFPCYLFVRLDLDVMGLSTVAWTPGLRRVVSFGDRPAPVPDRVVDLVRARLAELRLAGEWPTRDLRPGDPVRITAGPLQDMVAIFEGPTTPARRVQVLLNILGRLSRAQVEAGAIEKAAPGGPALPDPAARSRPPRRTRGHGRPIRSRVEVLASLLGENKG